MELESLLEQFLEEKGYVSVQMNKSVVGHFEVDAEIENRSALLLVDTGASNSVIHIDTADALGISSEEFSDCGGGLGTSQAAVKKSVIKELKLGALQLRSFPMYVIDLSHPNTGIEARGGRRIDGVIGADILGTRSAIIDYGEAKLYLKENDLSERIV